MRIPFIAGNWKMNKTADEAVSFVREIKADLEALQGVETAVCPPFLAIPALAKELEGSKIGLGAQNLYFEESGAYTGELSASMLAPYCQYVIIGHSERRGYFGETDESVNKKVKVALAHGLKPIICVGESLKQNEAGETHEFVGKQVVAALAGLSETQVVNCTIAYEPIWAIGTGKSASVEQAGTIIGQSVRQVIANLYTSVTAELIRIQYGGSVKPHNIADYMAHPDIDGALVGGASLKPAFVELVKNSIAS